MTLAITNIDPNPDQIGHIVTITGTGFGASQDDGFVTFAPNQTAFIVMWSDTSIACQVPNGTITGKVWVTLSGGGSFAESPDDFTVVVPATISGIVTLDSTPIEGVWVAAIDITVPAIMLAPIVDTRANYTSTSADGSYEILGLTSGHDYKILTMSPGDSILPVTWYGDVANGAAATVVSFAGTPITGIDINVPSAIGTVISGATSDWPSGESTLQGFIIDPDVMCYVGTISADAEGAYSVTGTLRTDGTYLVIFVVNGDVEYFGWYGSTTYLISSPDLTQGFDDAETVAGDATNINFDFRYSPGTPLENVNVYAIDPSTGEIKYNANTDVNGKYYMPVDFGEYKVLFSAAGLNFLGGDYKSVWFNNKLDFANSDSTTAPIRSINSTLNIISGGDTISGTVTDNSLNPLENIWVFACDAESKISLETLPINMDVTASNGTYTVTGLDSSIEYVIVAIDLSSIYYAQVYDSLDGLSSLDVSNVISEAELVWGGTSGKDFALTPIVV